MSKRVSLHGTTSRVYNDMKYCIGPVVEPCRICEVYAVHMFIYTPICVYVMRVCTVNYALKTDIPAREHVKFEGVD